MSQRTGQRLVWFGSAFSGVLVAGGLVLSVFAIVASSGQIGPAPHQFFNPVIVLTFSTVGALIVVRHPRNPVGWMIYSMGFLSALDLLALGYMLYSRSMTVDNPLPGAEFAEWLDSWLWRPSIGILLTFLLLLFPDGQLLSPRWRPVAWLAGFGLVAGTLVAMVSPLTTNGSTKETETVGTIALVLLGASVLGSIASLVVRFRRARGIERAQIKWLIYALSVTFTLMLAVGVAAALRLVDPSVARELSIISSGVIIVGIIVAIGIAIIRHHLYDIDILINRTLVYGVLTTLIVATYILVVGVLGALVQSRGSLPISLVATTVVAVGFQPMRDRLQRTANRLMYGERDDPYAVLSHLGERLEGVLALDVMLSTLVETVAQSLKLPFVAIESGSGNDSRIAAAFGQPITETERFPLIFQAEIVGHLIVAPRASGEGFNPAEKNLLANIAHQAGAAVHAAQLTADLQRSRARLVTAREEERRRLRRDLHDGLGPILASKGLKLAAARQSLGGDKTSVEMLLDQMITQNEASVAEIRRVVYGLRPPALDERGLVQAIRDHVAGLDGKGAAPGGLRVDVENQPAALPPLPAAVEVAAYRIALEALTNVIHHAQAQRCAIRFLLQSREARTFLRVEVSDNGVGLPASLQAGVGLRSMRERAEELGGTLRIESVQAGGTRLLADLPLDGEL